MIFRPFHIRLVTSVAAAILLAFASPAAEQQERPEKRITIPALVTTVAFGNDGRTLIAWDPVGFSIWDIERGRTTSREPVFGKTCGRAASLPRSDDGVAIGVNCKGRLALFEVATGRALGEWKLREKQTAVAFTASLDGPFAAAVMAGATHAVEVADRSGGAPKATVKAAQEVDQVSFSAGARYLATGSVDGVQVWALPDGRAMHTIKGGPSHAFSADGRVIAVDRDRDVGLFDVEAGTSIREFPGAVAQVRFSPDGSLLAGWTNQNLTVWDVASGTQRVALKGDQFVAAAMSPDATRLVTASMEMRGDATSTTLAVWRLAPR